MDSSLIKSYKSVESGIDMGTTSSTVGGSPAEKKEG
jgi:hypothetical protein